MKNGHLLALTVVPLVLGACTTTVTGHGNPGAAPPSATGGHFASGSATAPATGAASGSATPSTGASATGTAPTVSTSEDLTQRLEPGPADSKPWGNAWSDDVTPSTADFVAHVYAAADRDDAQARLAAEGLTDIAHRTWYADDSDQADDVLLRFGTAAGAQSRFLAATSAQASGTSTEVTVAAVPDVVGYSKADLDSLGNIETIFYVRRGIVVLELFYYSPATYRAADAETWLAAQVALL